MDYQVSYKSWNRQELKDGVLFEVQGVLTVENETRTVNADLIPAGVS